VDQTETSSIGVRPNKSLEKKMGESKQNQLLVDKHKKKKHKKKQKKQTKTTCRMKHQEVSTKHRQMVNLQMKKQNNHSRGHNLP